MNKLRKHFDIVKLPKTRDENIVVQRLKNEVLLYDLIINKAYCLNENSAIVYQACDGKTPLNDFKKESRLTDEIIFLALDDLKKENLLEQSAEYNSPFSGMNRREVIRKIGLASMIALPIISSLLAPTASMAQSATCVSDGSTSPATAPNTGNSFLDRGLCYQNAVNQCCSGGSNGFAGPFNGTTNPVTCTMVCGNVPLTF